MLPKRMEDLDNSAYYARYIEVEKGLPRRPKVYAAKPSDFSKLLDYLNHGPDKRLIRGDDNLEPDAVIISGIFVAIG